MAAGLSWAGPEEAPLQILLILIALAVAIGAVVVYARRRYAGLYDLRHVELVAERVATLRSAAIDRFGEPIAGAGDPRATVTPAGLALAYTIDADGDGYRHHVSVSRVGGRTTRAVGGRFLIFAVKRLQVPGMEVGLGVTPSGVHHAEWVLDAEQQALFVDQPPAAMDADALATLFAACLDEAGRAPFEALPEPG